jgi:hypothetical protein
MRTAPAVPVSTTRHIHSTNRAGTPPPSNTVTLTNSVTANFVVFIYGKSEAIDRV